MTDEYRRAERVRAPDFAPGLDWVNTGGRPLALADLRGKILLLDFWTARRGRTSARHSGRAVWRRGADQLAPPAAQQVEQDPSRFRDDELLEALEAREGSARRRDALDEVGQLKGTERKPASLDPRASSGKLLEVLAPSILRYAR